MRLLPPQRFVPSFSMGLIFDDDHAQIIGLDFVSNKVGIILPETIQAATPPSTYRMEEEFYIPPEPWYRSWQAEWPLESGSEMRIRLNVDERVKTKWTVLMTISRRGQENWGVTFPVENCTDKTKVRLRGSLSSYFSLEMTDFAFGPSPSDDTWPYPPNESDLERTTEDDLKQTTPQLSDDEPEIEQFMADMESDDFQSPSPMNRDEFYVEL